ncbi:MAG: RagB/SusD family nutrient uptake outer membrane protein [Prevotella sp.]|nr:RagB/SusD family nutrient uptake outer membrane protein [Prevotella sp.]
MKKIIYIISLLVLSFSGCYDLDTYPGDAVNQNQFWKNEAHVKQGLMGVYSALRADQVFGLQFMFDNLSEIGTGYHDQSYATVTQGIYSGRTGFVESKWQTLYEMVQRSNGFIRNVQNVNFLTDTEKNAYIAEGKFLRALFYFSLMDLYGALPYYDESVDVNASYNEMKEPRSSVEQIRSYILNDLDAAISGLPAQWEETQYGRATKGSAYALRGKVYLYNKEWVKATADFEEVVYNKTYNYGYQLYDNYKELFALYGTKKSKEMIFAIQNIGGVGNENGMRFAFYLGTRSTFGSCWNNGMPSTDLADMYENIDGKPFDWNDVFPGYNTATPAQRRDFLCIKLSGNGQNIESLLNADTAKILNAYRNRDPRLMASLIVPYSYYLGWNLSTNVPRDMHYILHSSTGGTPSEANGFIRNNQGSAWATYFWRKFVPEGDLKGALTDRSYSPIEFPLIRLADVLLMLSEAYNENNQLDKSIIEFNKVRNRPGVDMPGLNSGPAWLAVTTKEQMRERIYKERAVELACEGHRFSDLRRWGIAKTILDKRPVSNIYGEKLYDHVFTDRDMLWPVPSAEIEINPDLKPNNTGWE